MPRPTPEAADNKPGTYRVLVKQADRIEGASVVTPYGWEKVSEAQHAAYCEGRSDWRTAGAGTGGWWGRSWRRIFGTE